MCVAVSASKALESPGTNTPFLLDPILVDLEGGRYVGPILTVPLADLLAGQRLDGVCGNSGGGRGNSGDGNGSSGNSGSGRFLEVRKRLAPLRRT